MRLPSETVTYFAISLFSSRTFWLNAGALFVAICSLTEVVTIVPLRYMPTYSAIVACVNLILRFTTVRPVALIAPGGVVAVQVPKLDPPPPALVSD
jgi:hypothetical protein